MIRPHETGPLFLHCSAACTTARLSSIRRNGLPSPLWHRLRGQLRVHGFSTGAVEVTRDKKVVWEFADHAHFKAVCQVQVLDTPADSLRGEVLR
mgnify:CR=1 FL=1